MFPKYLLFIILITSIYNAETKIYGRCEFARTILRYGLKKQDLGTWTCIAKHESHYNTNAINHGTGDYGIFQISELYWCNNGRQPGKECGITCSSLLSDDIAIDVECVKKIKRQQGFTAWLVYPKYCTGDNSAYIQGCFDREF